MNNQGYSIKELIILFSVLGIFFAVGIAKGSYALEDAYNEDELNELRTQNIISASKVYAVKENLEDSETYIYGSTLVSNGLLNENDDLDYNQIKIKITKNEDDSYSVEIVSS